MAAPPTPPPPRRRSSMRWAVSIVLGVIAIVVVLAIASISFVLSPSGLPFVVARVVAQSGGRLSVEGPSGWLASSMHFDRRVWRGTDATTTAPDVAVEWQ